MFTFVRLRRRGGPPPPPTTTTTTNSTQKCCTSGRACAPKARPSLNMKRDSRSGRAPARATPSSTNGRRSHCDGRTERPSLNKAFNHITGVSRFTFRVQRRRRFLRRKQRSRPPRSAGTIARSSYSILRRSAVQRTTLFQSTTDCEHASHRSLCTLHILTPPDKFIYTAGVCP